MRLVGLQHLSRATQALKKRYSIAPRTLSSRFPIATADNIKLDISRSALGLNLKYRLIVSTGTMTRRVRSGIVPFSPLSSGWSRVEVVRI